jgi:peptidyl-prolyl cis-trans isomerase C
MKRFFSRIGITLVLLFSLGGLAGAANKSAKPVSSEVAAVVNGKTITQQELAAQLQRVKQRAKQQGGDIPEERIDQIRKDILDNLIDQELLFQETVKAGIKVDSAAVASHLSGFKKQFPSEDKYKDALKEIGMSEEELTAAINKGMSIQELITTRITKDLTVSEDESKAFYQQHPEYFKRPEQVKASHILIKAGPEATAEQKAEAQKKIAMIGDQLKKGKDFAELARQYGEDGTKEKGGDLGYFARGQMVKPFEDAAFAMQPGQTSEMVTTPFGYHLVKVTDRRAEGMTEFSEAKESIERHLKQAKTEKQVKDYVENLRKNAKIEVKPKTP